MLESQDLLDLKPPQCTPSPRPAWPLRTRRGAPIRPLAATWLPVALALRVAWPQRTCSHHARKEGWGISPCPLPGRAGRKSRAYSSPLLP